jgi:hypothetical protein
MNKLLLIALLLGCGWLVWSLTSSIENSTVAHQANTDEMAQQLDPGAAPATRRTAKDDAADKARSWQKAIINALPGTPSTKKNILIGAGLLAAAALIFSALRKK